MIASPKICQCGKRAHNIDSRQHDGHVRRRYECDCGERWTTYEVRGLDDNPDAVAVRLMKDRLADQLIAMAQDMMK